LVHVSENVSVADGATDLEPLTACAPLQPPDAVQPVALMPDQVRVVEPPALMELAARESDGAPGGMSASAASAWMNP
jgi:hypothetical protein